MGLESILDLDAKPERAILRFKVKDFQNGVAPSSPDILDFAKRAGVVAGFDVPALEKALADGRIDAPIRIAQCRPPVPGADSQLRFLVSPDVNAAPLASGDQRVDFREIRNLVLVKKGDRLAVLEAPKAGVPGLDIFGKPLPAAPGRMLQFPAGPNTRYLEDGVTLSAECPGFLYRYGDSLAVGTEFVVDGDVDFKTGNINFPGDIHVKGGIGAGFTVTAGGNVVVEGDVDSATVISGGNVTLHSGCFGKGVGRIQAKGALRVEFAQQTSLECKQLFASKFLQDCKIIAAGIDASAKGCYVRGGSIICYGPVLVYELGSESGNMDIRILDEQEEAFRTELANLELMETQEREPFDLLERKLRSFKALLAKSGSAPVPPKVAAEMKVLVEEYQNHRRKLANIQSEKTMIQGSLDLPRERRFSLKILGSVTGSVGLELFYIRRIVTKSDSGKEILVLPDQGLVAR